jgi:hypothetical protein
VAGGRPGGSVRRVPSPPAACLRGKGQGRGASPLRGEGQPRGEGRRGPAAGPRGMPAVSGMRWRRAAAWVRGTACPRGTAWPREAAWHGQAAAPPLVACGRGVAWEAAGRRAHTAPGRARPDSSRAGTQDAAAVRRSAGFPGCPGHPASRARDHPWARRAGRLASRRSSGSARTADRNATRDRCPRPGRQRGAGPGAAPAMCRALVTCRARGTPQVADRHSPSGDPP